MSLERKSKLFLGVDYSPEKGNKADIDTDIALMQQCGVNLVRIGQGCSNIISLSDGEFDFSIFHSIIPKLQRAKINIVFAVPSSFPFWFAKQKSSCVNNQIYVKYVLKTLDIIGQELSFYSNIIGFELGFYKNDKINGCFCASCIKKFKRHLKNVYNNDIKKLNLAIKPYSEGVTYSSFEEITVTEESIFKNNILLIEWYKFKDKCISDFNNLQIDTLHRYTEKPVIFAASSIKNMYFNRNSFSEIVSCDIKKACNFSEKLFMLDLSRSIKFSSFFASDEAVISHIFENNEFYLNSFLPYIMGAKTLFLGKWKDTDNPGIISPYFRPSFIWEELQKLSKDLVIASDILENTRVVSDIGILFSNINRIIAGAENYESMISIVINNFYKPIIDMGFRPNIFNKFIPDECKLLFAPLSFTFDIENNWHEIEKWVEAGGIFVVGPDSDIRTDSGERYKNSPFGHLERLTSVFVRYQMELKEHVYLKAKTINDDELNFSGNIMIFDSDEHDFAVITEGINTIKDKAIIKKYDLGKGKIIILGGIPDILSIKKIITYVSEISQVKPMKISSNIVAVKRRGSDDLGQEYRTIILCEVQGKKGYARLDNGMIDILTGQTVIGDVQLNPYSVHILNEIS